MPRNLNSRDGDDVKNNSSNFAYANNESRSTKIGWTHHNQDRGCRSD